MAALFKNKKRKEHRWQAKTTFCSQDRLAGHFLNLTAKIVSSIQNKFNYSKSTLRGIGGGPAFLVPPTEDPQSELSSIFSSLDWVSCTFESRESSFRKGLVIATAFDRLSETGGETLFSAGGSLCTGLGLGLTGGGAFKSGLWGGLGLGALSARSFWAPASLSPRDGLDFARGGATGLSVVSGTLGCGFVSCSITTERGLGLGTGFETDADRGIGAGWSAALDSFVVPGAWVELLSESRDVSFVSEGCFSLLPSPYRKKKTSVISVPLINNRVKMRWNYRLI